jgi:hypothetical protein
MNMIKMLVVYISGAKGMENDHSHEIELPAVPRAGDYLFLPEEDQELRKFTVQEVRWFPGMTEPRETIELWITYVPKERTWTRTRS